MQREASARFLRETKTETGDLNRAWSNAWGAALAHNPTYAPNASEDMKKQLRQQARAKVAEIANHYRNRIGERDHEQNILNLSHSLSAEFSEILRGGQFRIGTAQKLLNLYLKFLWCFAEVAEPPHCPLDRVVQENAKVRPVVNWTQINSVEEYHDAIHSLREAVCRLGFSGMALAEWEIRYGWAPIDRLGLEPQN